MKNEFGHIIKKKVENSSMTPPPMDWQALSDAQKATPKTSKPFFTTKLGLVISGFVSLAVITVAISLFITESESIETSKPAVLKERIKKESKPVQKDVQPEILDTVTIPIKEEKKINPPLKKRKKKDKFEHQVKQEELNSAENKKTEQSTTTILYEVDTVTTETYIYE